MLEEIRLAGPVVATRFANLTTSHAVVREVLNSPDFRTGFPDLALPGPLGKLAGWAADTGVLGPIDPPSLLVTDGADHLRYRKLVTRVFSVRAVETLRAKTEQIADELLDDLAGRSEVDLVQAYCTLLPVTVISEILGLPPTLRDRILTLGEGGAPSLDLGLSWRRFRLVENCLAELDAILGTHLEQLRAEPGQDLLSQLVLAQDDGRGLTERELRSIAGLVLAAGFETTVNLLGSGLVLLCQNPEQRQILDQDPRCGVTRSRRFCAWTPRCCSPGGPRSTTSTSPGRRSWQGRLTPRSWRQPTATPRSSPTPAGSTSHVTTPKTTSASRVDGTSASARPWPAWTAKWACEDSWTATPTSRSRRVGHVARHGSFGAGRRCP